MARMEGREGMGKGGGGGEEGIAKTIATNIYSGDNNNDNTTIYELS